MNVMNRVIVRRSFLLQRNAFALKNVQSLILQNNMNNTVLTLNNFNHNVKFAHSKVPRGGGKQKKGKAKALTGDEPESDFDSSKLISVAEQAMKRLKEELAGLRTNKASPDILKKVVVRKDGNTTPLIALAQITVKDPKTLLVSVFDDNNVGIVGSSIQQANLGLNPSTHGSNSLLVPIPKMTDDFREKLRKLISNIEEEAKQKIRRARQDALKQLKSLKLAKDDEKRLEMQIQATIDVSMGEIETETKKKTDEISK